MLGPRKGWGGGPKKRMGGGAHYFFCRSRSSWSLRSNSWSPQLPKAVSTNTSLAVIPIKQWLGKQKRSNAIHFCNSSVFGGKQFFRSILLVTLHLLILVKSNSLAHSKIKFKIILLDKKIKTVVSKH